MLSHIRAIGNKFNDACMHAKAEKSREVEFVCTVHRNLLKTEGGYYSLTKMLTCILHVVYMQSFIMIAICVQFSSTGLHANCSHSVHTSTKFITNLLLYCMQTV